ncbi:hypothetical protein EV198_0496 [Roseivirga ehrenbergii]|uniref:Uncharacterized protein n=1 Tax=Roseivirga ehrenbergii (strain DSM 102268 / JCM 13514 / KCTC 12282 / NCIMB 14502 / KMM 6017) TaxID=279360 RepID=A0A150X8C6_ROSEK|nr:hypothetical protein [Roseivirga ehrenbergii]KYG74985.1 hypothetical protein MB14_07230 [Roseivirga ehrenbergii]TCL13666.1 hypothetical protein EV198_0496 [Roseivirga ehrenbergii]
MVHKVVKWLSILFFTGVVIALIFLANFELFENESVLLEELNHEGKTIRIYYSPSNATIERSIVVMLKEVSGESSLAVFERFDVLNSYEFGSGDTLKLTLEDTFLNKGSIVEMKVYIPK